ncbi:MAG: hypothetical protein KAS94_09065 [Desulfobulbaceae bacterium]|nr:hypothetical protein [Desulfobulbaceae bacterium]
MRYAKINAITAAILSLLILSGCGGMTMTGGYIDPGFVHQSILEGRMAIVGVVSSVQDLTVKERNDYAAVLKTNIMEYRKDYSVTSSGDLVNKIGRDNYNLILDNYKVTGGLSTENLQTIKEAMGVKYAVISRIESDETTKDKRTPSMSYSGKIEAKATRTMTASLNIYDIDTGKSVFGGNIEGYEYETEYHDKYTPRNDFASGLAGIINAAKGKQADVPQTEDELYPYPFIDPKRILNRIFQQFSRNLPKK